MNPQTADEATVSEDPSELAVFMVTGMCPRCGKVSPYSNLDICGATGIYCLHPNLAELLPLYMYVES